jgi:tetratricopeptide (TPR) repeat protein
VNRERLLFLGVLAILGLWFVLRAPPRPVADATPGKTQLARRPVGDAALPETLLGGLATREPFTLKTNVKPHPRPLDDLEKPRPFDLPNIWPPTSRGPSIDRLSLLRRDAAAPQDGAAQIKLPEPAAQGAGSAGPAVDRLDTWKSHGVDYSGRVTLVIAGGKEIKEPSAAWTEWPYGEEVLKPEWKFLRALVLLDDPDRAKNDEGVTGVWAKAERALFKQSFPDEIDAFKIAVQGRQKGYVEGLRTYLDVRRSAGDAVDPRVTAGQGLLAKGIAANKDRGLLRWALALLEEARGRVAAGAQDTRRAITLAMLDAAGGLNDYERVLALVVDHLATFAGEQQVIEHAGNVLGSRSFSLAPFSIEWLKLAPARPSAQYRLVEMLVGEGRFEEAKEVLASRKAGAAGPAIDLLRARVALALGELDEAASVAAPHASTAEGREILGAVAYTRGDAAAAEKEFLQAVEIDPTRSTAYSDLGLALAVQGKAADALLCFTRALELDSIDNAVAPELGRAILKLASGEGKLRAAASAEDEGRKDPRTKADKDNLAATLRNESKEEFAAADAMLGTLQNNNPSDLLVRYMVGYAKERTGNLEEAARLYRATIDGDSRYRIAIARLGLVQARRVGAGNRALAGEAIAHLSKAVELSPQEAILPYVLARFLMTIREELGLAREMFASAEGLDVSERNGDLPLWAQLGRAWLAYADDNTEERQVKSMLIALLDRIKDKLPSGLPETELMKHEVYRAATINLQIVQENEKKWDRSWEFTSLSAPPPEWERTFKNPMEIRIERGKGLVFAGEVNYGGERPTTKVVLESCAVKYDAKDELTGGSFWELEVTGVVPEGKAAVGIALGNPGKSEDGPPGVHVRRKPGGSTMEVKLDGGDRTPFKETKTKSYVDLKSVTWPAGEFRLKIEVVPEYGPPVAQRRAQGRFRILLNGEEVFAKEFKDDFVGEKSAIFGRGRASQQVLLYLWAEGRDGDAIQEIQVKTVKLTVEVK